MDHNQASILEYEEVARMLQTDLKNGLTSFEARERLKKHGPNRLESESGTETVPRRIYLKLLQYLNQFINPLIQLLIVCAIVGAAIGEYESAASVALSVVLVCSIGFVQERRAERSRARLTRKMPNLCQVIREGQLHELEAQALVPGDIVQLAEGQRVPADVRLFEARSLSLDEANLSGETQSQAKSVEPTSQKMAALLSGQSSSADEQCALYQNLALMSTIVEAGQARGIVVCTGKATRHGQVFSLLKSGARPPSALRLSIDRLCLQLVVAGCSLIACLSVLGVLQQRPAPELARLALSLAEATIPEGLPVVAAVVMALGVLRLSRRKSVVRSLANIETLGCVQVLCADKTGTLTRTQMTPTDIVTSELHSLSSAELEELNNEECRKQMTFNKFGGKMYAIGRLIEAGTLCNNASPEPLGESEADVACRRRFIGQATECALLDAAVRLGFGDSRTKFDRLAELPFNSSRRRMAVKCQRLDLPGNSPHFYVKGAWEEVLADCAHYYECGLVKPRTEEMWLEYERICTALGSQGLRVLALASGPSMEQLTFLGLVGINNAPREGLVEALGRLRSLQVGLKMITGDSRATALAVSRALGLLEAAHEGEQQERLLMSGRQLDQLLSSELDPLAQAQEINSKACFYRVDPLQKANIVSKLQELGRVVAMAGDGLNDVLSLRRADLSLAMGSGADVCKELADVVMVDDDLCALVPALLEGRAVYPRLHSFLAFQISLGLSLLALTGLSFAARTELPLTALQLLFINILADGPLAQTLGAERLHERDLDPMPRDLHEPVLGCRQLPALAALTSALVFVNGLLYYFLLDDDGSLDTRASSILFTCYVFCSLFAAISLRSKVKTVFESSLLGNKELLCCSLLVVLLQLALLNLGFLNSLFQLEPIACLELVYLFLYASSVLAIMDTVKIVVRLFDYTKRRLAKSGALPSIKIDICRDQPAKESP